MTGTGRPGSAAPWGRRAGIVLALLALAASACEVGDGAGAASGQLYVESCSPDGTLGSPQAPVAYDMRPEFFAGEPIEDVRPNGRENRIVIRLETGARSIRRSNKMDALGPVKDILYFDMDSFAVARCVRAAALGAASPDVSYCLITPEGKARVRVGPEQVVRVSFAPRATCPRNVHVVAMALGDDPLVGGVRVPVPPQAWLSWVELTAFGSAARVDPGATFKVEFGQTLNANAFQLALEDDRIVKAGKRDELPPAREIMGSLTGFFDFDLERGQGAQTFP